MPNIRTLSCRVSGNSSNWTHFSHLQRIRKWSLTIRSCSFCDVPLCRAAGISISHGIFVFLFFLCKLFDLLGHHLFYLFIYTGGSASLLRIKLYLIPKWNNPWNWSNVMFNSDKRERPDACNRGSPVSLYVINKISEDWFCESYMRPRSACGGSCVPSRTFPGHLIMPGSARCTYTREYSRTRIGASSTSNYGRVSGPDPQLCLCRTRTDSILNRGKQRASSPSSPVEEVKNRTKQKIERSYGKIES